MNIPKPFHIVVLHALALGLILASEAPAARHPAATKPPPVIIIPFDEDAGPTIVPNGGGSRPEYRQVFFRGQSRSVISERW